MSSSLSSDLESIELLAAGALPPEAISQLAARLADERHLGEVAAALTQYPGAVVTALRNHPKGANANVDRVVDALLRRLGDVASVDGTLDNTQAYPAAAGDGSSPPPSRLDAFQIQRVLGQGGMGTVYLADDPRLGRQVALKTLKRELAEKPGAVERFLREARTAARVEHDHICPIYQVGEDNGVPYIAMPFLKGEPLDALLKRERPLPVPEAIRIGREIALGLAVAHEAGLIHRDIKPANVWLETVRGRAPRARILDFGLARGHADEGELTASGAILGTPAYMAPEQARGHQVDGRADLWSLGVVLYEMTTGRRPFTGENTMAILTSLAMDDPPAPHALNPGVPAVLSALIQRLLAKNRDARPADAQAVADELLAVQIHATLPVVEALPAAPPPARSAPTAVMADPWGGIDSAESGPPAAKPARAPAKKPSAHVPLLLAVTLGLALVAGGGLAAYKLVFETPVGLLVVETDGDADIRFKNGKLELYDDKGALKYTLEPAEKNKAIAAGKYHIKVAGADGVRVETDAFTLDKGGRAFVRVTADRPPAAAKNDPAKPAADPDRRLAEYVVSVGGAVALVDDATTYSAATALPKTPFRVRSVHLMQNRRVTDAGLAAVKGCKEVTSLNLYDTPTGDAGLAAFQDCKNLTGINLGLTGVTDAGLARVKGCRALAELSLSGTAATDAGMANFAGCPKLRFLILEGTGVTDAGLANFKDCKVLERLTLAHAKVTDAGLAHFKDVPTLDSLELGSTGVTDAGLANFAGCRKLVSLNFSDMRISDAGLAAFRDCDKVAVVYLDRNPQLTDAALAHLKPFKALSHLHVSATSVTAAGLASLPAHKNLVLLNISDTAVGDEGVKSLQKLTALKELYVWRTKITPAALKQLAAQLPKCRIEHDGGVTEPAK